MPVWDTEENGRSWMTERVVGRILQTVDMSRHRLVIVDNGSCDRTRDILANVGTSFAEVVRNEENRGVAYACNQALSLRQPGEVVIKMDNDCLIHESTSWADQLEECIRLRPDLGILGLKRPDLGEWPLKPVGDPERTTLIPLPHSPGSRFYVIERVGWLMIGTCTALNPAMLDKIGYYWHTGTYGHEDSILAARSKAAGFINAYLPSIRIEHLEESDTPYKSWKLSHAQEHANEAVATMNGILAGKLPYYRDWP